MDKRFILAPTERCPITVLDSVPFVRLPLNGQVALKHIKKRSRVAKGTPLSENSNPERGDLHAPFDAIVKEVTSTFIEMEYSPLPLASSQPKAAEQPAAEDGKPAVKNAETLPEPVLPIPLNGLETKELHATLKCLGISTENFTKPCEIFIINGLNPEPGMLYTQELLAGHMPVLEAGFNLLRRLITPQRFVLALPEGSNASLEGAASFHVKPVYPISLRKPLIRAITGKEKEEHVGFVRLHELFKLGLVAESGLPLTRTIITVLGKNYIAPLGTTLETFFELAGVPYEEGDSVVMGGAMRGQAMSSLHRGIGKSDEAVQLFKKNSMPKLEDNPCIGCGACVDACPVRLRPNMLSRYAEFRQYEGCRKEHLEICIECGMCGYVCPACRPMQQYFRMAKFNLGMKSRQNVVG